jgi:hypothetical protein
VRVREVNRVGRTSRKKKKPQPGGRGSGDDHEGPFYLRARDGTRYPLSMCSDGNAHAEKKKGVAFGGS